MSSIVSSRQLAALAAHRRVEHRQALTGFKWIARIGYADGATMRFGYEEALGYACSTSVRDKDGLSAALVFVGLAQDLAAQGKTVLDRLDELALITGLHLTTQVTIRFDDVAEAAEAVGRLRRRLPTAIGRWPVTSTTDFGPGINGWPPTDLLVFDLEGGGQVLIRPSGTEPKLKAYLEVVAPVAELNEAAHVRQRAGVDLAALREAVRSLISG